MQNDKVTEQSPERPVPEAGPEVGLSSPKPAHDLPVRFEDLLAQEVSIPSDVIDRVPEHYSSIFQDLLPTVIAPPLVPGQGEWTVQIEKSKLAAALNLIAEFADDPSTAMNLAVDFGSQSGDPVQQSVRLTAQEAHGSISCEVPLVGQGLNPPTVSQRPKFKVNLGLLRALVNATPSAGVIGFRIRPSRNRLVVVVDDRERPISLHDLTRGRSADSRDGEHSFAGLDVPILRKVLGYLALFAEADSVSEALRCVSVSEGAGRAGSRTYMGLVRGEAIQRLGLRIDVDLATRLERVLGHFSPGTVFATTHDRVIIKDVEKELILSKIMVSGPDLESIVSISDESLILIPRVTLQTALDGLVAVGGGGVVNISITADEEKVSVALSAKLDNEVWDDVVSGVLRGPDSFGAWMGAIEGLPLLRLLKSLGSANAEIRVGEGFMAILGDIEGTNLTTTSIFTTHGKPSRKRSVRP